VCVVDTVMDRVCVGDTVRDRECVSDTCSKASSASDTLNNSASRKVKWELWATCWVCAVLAQKYQGAHGRMLLV
jgi:hypothetical protein